MKTKLIYAVLLACACAASNKQSYQREDQRSVEDRRVVNDSAPTTQTADQGMRTDRKAIIDSSQNITSATTTNVKAEGDVTFSDAKQLEETLKAIVRVVRILAVSLGIITGLSVLSYPVLRFLRLKFFPKKEK